MARIQSASQTVWLKPEEKEAFMATCKEQAVNPSELMRQWIRSYVEEHKAEAHKSGQ